MAKLKDQAAQLGIGTLVAGLKAVESGVTARLKSAEEKDTALASQQA